MERKKAEKKKKSENAKALVGFFFPGTNAAMNHIAGRSFSSFLNFTTGLSLCLLGFAADLLIFRTPPPKLAKLRGKKLPFCYTKRFLMKTLLFLRSALVLMVR